jgi:hypothetical protein
MVELKSQDLAWLAAALDGEGCITLTKRRRSISGKEYQMVSIALSVANNNLPFILEAKRIIDNIINPVFASSVREKRLYTGNINYSVAITNVEAANLICSALLPFLIVKKDKAFKVLAWFEIRGGNQRGKRFSDEERASMESILN